MISYRLFPTRALVIHKGKSLWISSDDPLFHILKQGDQQLIQGLFHHDYYTKEYKQGDYICTPTDLYHKGVRVEHKWADIILTLRKSYQPFQPFMKALNQFGLDMSIDQSVLS